jgi:hypothetical protein
VRWWTRQCSEENDNVKCFRVQRTGACSPILSLAPTVAECRDSVTKLSILMYQNGQPTSFSSPHTHIRLRNGQFFFDCFRREILPTSSSLCVLSLSGGTLTRARRIKLQTCDCIFRFPSLRLHLSLPLFHLRQLYHHVGRTLST